MNWWVLLFIQFSTCFIFVIVIQCSSSSCWTRELLIHLGLHPLLYVYCMQAARLAATIVEKVISSVLNFSFIMQSETIVLIALLLRLPPSPLSRPDDSIRFSPPHKQQQERFFFFFFYVLGATSSTSSFVRIIFCTEPLFFSTATHWMDVIKCLLLLLSVLFSSDSIAVAIATRRNGISNCIYVL